MIQLKTLMTSCTSFPVAYNSLSFLKSKPYNDQLLMTSQTF